jgi:hypothetical protein
VHHSKIKRLRSPLGQERPICTGHAMPTLSPIAAGSRRRGKDAVGPEAEAEPCAATLSAACKQKGVKTLIRRRRC